MAFNISTQLNKEQRAAVTCGKGVNIVYSGAGTGKTTIISHRFAYLFNQKRINPSNILALTYTRKAASEMKQRILELLPEKYHKDVNIYTFHSFCSRFLREEGQKNFVIDDDLSNFLKDFLKESELKSQKVLQIIDGFKNAYFDFDTNSLKDDERLVELCEFHLDPQERNFQLFKETAIAAFVEYEKGKQQNNKIDFADLLIKTCTLLSKDHKLLRKWSKKFQYILGDEFQDTNQIQYELIKMLASHHQNLFLVGDNNQMIYRWRGAVSDIIDSLKSDFKVRPENEFYITQNYRCDQNILTVANSILGTIYAKENQPDSTKGFLFSAIKSNRLPVYFQASSVEGQHSWIINKIKNLHKNHGIQYKDMAILFRTNRNMDSMTEALEADGSIPLKQNKGFFKQLETFKKVLVALITRSNYDIKLALKSLRVWPNVLNKSLTVNEQVNLDKILQNLEQAIFLDEHTRGELTEAAKVFTRLIKFVEEQQFEALLAFTFEALNTDQFVCNFIFRTLQKLQTENKNFTITDFINELRFQQDELKQSKDNVINLITVHSAKGLEFEAVFIYGINQDNFPLKSKNQIIDLQRELDELRLFYVALTRAKKYLFLLSVYQMSGEIIYPSKFIRFINKEDRLEIATINHKVHQDDEFFDSSKTEDYQKKYLTENTDFVNGDSVSHRTYGKGVVVEVREDAVCVAFKNSKYGQRWIVKNHRDLVKAVY